MVDKKVELSDSTLSLLQRVLDNVHTSIDAAQKAQDIYLDDALVNELQQISQSEANKETKSKAKKKHIDKKGC